MNEDIVNEYLDKAIAILKKWREEGMPDGAFARLWIKGEKDYLGTLDVSSHLRMREAHYYALEFLRQIERKLQEDKTKVVA